jgi:hypothetical protein
MAAASVGSLSFSSTDSKSTQRPSLRASNVEATAVHDRQDPGASASAAISSVTPAAKQPIGGNDKRTQVAEERTLIVTATDKLGVQVDLISPYVDYTEPSIEFPRDKETGLRLTASEGYERLDWTSIRQVTFSSRSDDDALDPPPDAEVLLSNGTVRAVDLPFVHQLHGYTKVGPYEIWLGDLAAIKVKDVSTNELQPCKPNDCMGYFYDRRKIAMLIVVDTKGRIMKLRDPVIDYTQYGPLGFGYVDDDELGIRIKYRRGHGVVTVPWGFFRSLQCQEDSKLPGMVWRAELESQREGTVQLVWSSKDGLSGRSSDGVVSISLQNIEAILPVAVDEKVSTQMDRARRIAIRARTRYTETFDQSMRQRTDYTTVDEQELGDLKRFKVRVLSDEAAQLTDAELIAIGNKISTDKNTVIWFYLPDMETRRRPWAIASRSKAGTLDIRKVETGEVRKTRP